MDRGLRALVERRAEFHCEYCCLPQASSPFARFHVEHIIARQHGGISEEQNLALACNFCNLHKGPNIASLTEAGILVPLFHPRRNRWDEYFQWQGVQIVGVTDIGSVTVNLLSMNDAQRLEVRENLRLRGESYFG